MTRETADELWGAEAVELALRDGAPDPITPDLAREIVGRVQSLPPGAFRAWALAQPWPRFCAIVRIVSGEALGEELDDDDRLARQVALRLSDEDMKRLDDLTESIPIASRNAIARAALRIGLAALEADPSQLFSSPKKKTRRR